MPIKVDHEKLRSGGMWTSLDEEEKNNKSEDRNNKSDNDYVFDDIEDLKVVEESDLKLRQFINTLVPGDIVTVDRYGLFSHSGIYVGDDKVIHLAMDKKHPEIKKLYVHEADFEDFLLGPFEGLKGFVGSTVKANYVEKLGVLDLNNIALKNGKHRTFVKLLESHPELFASDDEKQLLMDIFTYSNEEVVARAKYVAEHGVYDLPCEHGEGWAEQNYSTFGHNCEHFVIWCKTGISRSDQMETVLKAFSKFGEEVINRPVFIVKKVAHYTKKAVEKFGEIVQESIESIKAAKDESVLTEKDADIFYIEKKDE
ncbi:MAG: lecithin retinol acyltransferase family protein [Lachnospiraceae bacterium]|nr:lecithin retinol acyltransferase family protein [Lachnospiraceae bacterium]